MAEAVKKYSGADYYAWTDDKAARECALKLCVEVNEGMRKGDVLSALFDEFVEDKLIQPTIIYDYPVEISPLAKRKKDEPAFTGLTNKGKPVCSANASADSSDDEIFITLETGTRIPVRDTSL